MAMRINKEIRIIHEKYVVMFFRHILNYILNWVTIYQMAIRINKDMQIIHEKYVVMFLQTHASLYFKLHNHISNGYED